MDKIVSLEVQKGGHKIQIKPAQRSHWAHCILVDDEVILRTRDYGQAKQFFRILILFASVGELKPVVGAIKEELI